MFDYYCERNSADFWAEPINALSNFGFIIAGLIALFILYKSPQAQTFQSPARKHHQLILSVLAILISIIGIGSFLFHTFANQWSLFADIVPIYIFQVLFLLAYPRLVLQFSKTQTVFSFILFIVAVFASKYLPFDINGSEMYLPTILALLIFNALAKRKNKDSQNYLAYASTLFALSLTLRSIDNAICSILPLGTHFAWHLINACVLYLCWYAIYSACYKIPIVQKVN
ncbi:ceramidase domain-containing protein [Catenovulum sediminis]|uniref:Ceramidase domain-containing protein n=1 Tax=Catenovulum sediminis TaxID=1740262 RepID=A0ABV1RLL9_9ALTE|nr:ceramidase domain-containing protein [Catenovulum sediminis]